MATAAALTAANFFACVFLGFYASTAPAWGKYATVSVKTAVEYHKLAERVGNFSHTDNIVCFL
jgi:hypothetical protein